MDAVVEKWIRLLAKDEAEKVLLFSEASPQDTAKATTDNPSDAHPSPTPPAPTSGENMDYRLTDATGQLLGESPQWAQPTMTVGRAGHFFGYVPQMMLWEEDKQGKVWPKEINLLDSRGVSQWFVLTPVPAATQETAGR